MPYFSVKASESSADSGAVPQVTARMLSRSARGQVGVQHRPQCGRYQRDGAGPVFAHRGGPCVEFESFQQHKGSRLRDALQHPENAADMHQWRVDDRDAAAKLGRRRCLLGFGTHHAARQHVVAEVDSFGRAGCSAGQHPHGDHPGADRGCVAPARSRSSNRPEIDTVRSPGGDQRRQVVGLADDKRQVQRGDVGPGAVVAARRD